MARSRACRVCGGWHDLAEPWPSACYGHFGTIATGTGPNIRPDGMDAIENPVDGRKYDSKSAYYAAVKRAGCEIFGNETYVGKRPELPPVQHSMRQAIEQLKSR